MTVPNYSTAQIQQMIRDAAARYGLDPALMLAVAARESSFNPQATGHNADGSTDYGVMQLNTTTVAQYNVADPYDPATNIDVGARVLADLQARFGGDVTSVLWGYRAGPGRVVAGSAPPSGVLSYINWIRNYMGKVAGGAADTGTTADTTVVAEDQVPATDAGVVSLAGFNVSTGAAIAGLVLLVGLAVFLPDLLDG